MDQCLQGVGIPKEMFDGQLKKASVDALDTDPVKRLAEAAEDGLEAR